VEVEEGGGPFLRNGFEDDKSADIMVERGEVRHAMSRSGLVIVLI
jgi:hypothetical protein